MTTRDDWQAACDAVMGDVLDAAGIVAPPVDALLIAARLKWPVVRDVGQSGRARLQRIEGQPTLFVRPNDRPERLQWAVAHEIGEICASRVCQRLDITADELAPRQREELANQLAQRLLLPTPWFQAANGELAGDLLALKTRFATASHELIAWRWLDLCDPTIVTVFDQGTLSRRRCNFTARAPVLCSEESVCVTTARASRGTCDRSWPGGSCTAWAVHEPGWQREIARTKLEWDDG